jgi:CRISPR/Cas system-associated exonuclease Cas4 (RecB family)
MSNPTGSGLERAMRCPGSCALPRAGHTGEAAEYGNANHAAIEAGDRSKPVVALVFEDAEEVRQEVAYALNVATRTVREIGVNIGRDYGKLDENEIALTLDFEGKKRGEWWVVDWKSRERVTKAADNWQIRAAVLAVMERHGTDMVAGALAYLDDNELDAAPFDVFQAGVYWNELAAMVRRVRDAEARIARGETLDVASGSWCKYCPALPHCPAHTRLAAALLGELEGVDTQIASLTVEQCGRAWELLKRYDVIADRVRESIKARARSEVVPLTGGRRLALVEMPGRSSLDQDAVKARFKKLGEPVPMKRGRPFTTTKEVNGTEKTE